jgi:hypothetical protein
MLSLLTMHLSVSVPIQSELKDAREDTRKLRDEFRAFKCACCA